MAGPAEAPGVEKLGVEKKIGTQWPEIRSHGISCVGACSRFERRRAWWMYVRQKLKLPTMAPA
jgi:hypothetical protein